jgi:zinc/manganese transport system substrate-binding protein
VISTHDAFAYFAAAYRIAFIAPQGVSTEFEASAHDIASIIIQIKADKIPALFLENISDPRLIRGRRQDRRPGGRNALFRQPDRGKRRCPTYIDMVRHNIKALASVLKWRPFAPLRP